ncbi:ribonuclease H-like domain-containing protein [Tanacetum coccineum]|uniref:Ribonuclease H-like domain-containing protein n=1 Tax=Tanacetum coccineum TaxID=301880 RepID=A0ABQ5ES16_9ASTR
MYKLDLVTLAPKDKNNRETHIYYLKDIMEQDAILREIVEQAKSLNPLDSASYSACKYVKLIQELLGYTCSDIHKPGKKLVVVTPINKKITVRSKPVTKSADLEEEPAPTGDQFGPSALMLPKIAKQMDARRNQGKRYQPKFLRSLPSSWNQISLIMRNKPDIDKIDIDDLYNNLRVYEDELKSLQQMDGDDLEELDLRWQVAMLTVRVKKKGHFARECRSGRNQGRRSYGDNGRSNVPTNESSSHALVAQDDQGCYDWSNDFEVELVNYALMAISSSSSSSSSDSEKVVKERDELKDKIAKWEESTKNLDEILNSQMSARDKTGLGYSTQLNELSSNHETDSENSLSIFDGQTNAEKPKSTSESVVSNPKINRDRVIIEDWNSDDEEEEYEVQIVRPKTQTVQTRDDKSGQNSKKQGIGFRKVKACFVCKSTNHLIKDCNFHDKKSQEPKLKNVVNTGQREGKPVWDNTKRINHQNFSKYPHLSNTFVPLGVLTRTGLHRLSVSTTRPVCSARPSVSIARLVCIDRPSVSTARPSVSTVRPVYATRPIYPRMDNVRPRGSCSPIKRSYYTKPTFRPKDLKQNVKTFGIQNMTTVGIRVVVNTGKGKLDTNLKNSRWVWRPKGNYLDHVSKDNGSFMLKKVKANQRSLYRDHCSITCLYATATPDESKLWHKRLGHVNFKNINKLVKGHLVRGLPSKVFVNDHTCVACKKGKQHKASCKANGVMDGVMEDVPAKKKHVSFINVVQGLNKPGSNKLKLIPVCMNDQGKKVVDMDPLVEKAYHLDEIIMNDCGLYFLKFKSDEGMQYVLENGLWLVDGLPLFVQKWEAGMCMSKLEPKKVPLWVRIYDIHLEALNSEGISRISSMIGWGEVESSRAEGGFGNKGRGGLNGRGLGDQRFSKNEGSYYVLVKRNRVSRPINAKETNGNRKGKSKVDEGGSSKDSVGINEMDSETTNVGGRNVNKGDGNNRDGKNVNASRGGSNENSLKGVGYQNMFSAQLDEAEIERRLEWDSMKERIDESCEQGLRIS